MVKTVPWRGMWMALSIIATASGKSSTRATVTAVSATVTTRRPSRSTVGVLFQRVPFYARPGLAAGCLRDGDVDLRRP